MDAMTLATAFKMTIALGFVLIIFGVAIWIAKKTTGSRAGVFGRGNKANIKPLEVLAFQSLGPGKNLYLVRCYNKKVLVGATSQSINYVTDVAQDAEDETDTGAFETHLESKEQSSLTESGTHSSVEANTKSRFGNFLRDLSRV